MATDAESNANIQPTALSGAANLDKEALLQIP
jgi:hypothetical protein